MVNATRKTPLLDFNAIRTTGIRDNQPIPNPRTSDTGVKAALNNLFASNSPGVNKSARTDASQNSQSQANAFGDSASAAGDNRAASESAWTSQNGCSGCGCGCSGSDKQGDSNSPEAGLNSDSVNGLGENQSGSTEFDQDSITPEIPDGPMQTVE